MDLRLPLRKLPAHPVARLINTAFRERTVGWLSPTSGDNPHIDREFITHDLVVNPPFGRGCQKGLAKKSVSNIVRLDNFWRQRMCKLAGLAANPRIILCALTGCDSTGPGADLKAYGATVQAAAGLMNVTGLPGQPPMKTSTALSDDIAGSMAMSGIVAALYDRETTGKGQFVDVPMVDCLFSLLFDDSIDWHERLGLPVRQGNWIMRFSPVNTYQTRDGWVVLGAATAGQWHGMLRAISRADLLDDPDWSRVEWRLANNGTVDGLVQDWVDGMTIAAALHGPEDLADWEHLKERDMYAILQHPTLEDLVGVGGPGFPLKFSNASTGYQTPAALPRVHNQEVLGELLDITLEENARLEAAVII